MPCYPGGAASAVAVQMSFAFVRLLRSALMLAGEQVRRLWELARISRQGAVCSIWALAGAMSHPPELSPGDAALAQRDQVRCDTVSRIGMGASPVR